MGDFYYGPCVQMKGCEKPMSYDGIPFRLNKIFATSTATKVALDYVNTIGCLYHALRGCNIDGLWKAVSNTK